MTITFAKPRVKQSQATLMWRIGQMLCIGSLHLSNHLISNLGWAMLAIATVATAMIESK